MSHFESMNVVWGDQESVVSSLKIEMSALNSFIREQFYIIKSSQHPTTNNIDINDPKPRVSQRRDQNEKLFYSAPCSRFRNLL